MISFKNFSRLVGISLLNSTFLLHQKLFVNHLITCFSSKDLQLTLYLLCHILSVFTIIVYDSTECAGEFLSIFLFKNALGIPAARGTSCNACHILLCISTILPEAISDGRLNPTTDIILLLTTYRGGSHLTSDIKNSLLLPFTHILICVKIKTLGQIFSGP